MYVIVHGRRGFEASQELSVEGTFGESHQFRLQNGHLVREIEESLRSRFADRFELATSKAYQFMQTKMRWALR